MSKIKIELDVIETEELKKAVAAELDKINLRSKADIDSAIDKVLRKYIKDKDEDN